LKEAFPALTTPIPHQHEAMLREHRSFAIEDFVVDIELLERAKEAGYATKVVFISTEDPNLNADRILVRLSYGGNRCHWARFHSRTGKFNHCASKLPGPTYHQRFAEFDTI